jgi:hypothetical protein
MAIGVRLGTLLAAILAAQFLDLVTYLLMIDSPG